MSILRSIWSVFIGLLAGGLVIGVLQLLGMLFFPLPVTMERFNAMTTDEKRELLHAAPAMVFVPVLVGYALGMLVAGMVTTFFWVRRRLGGAVTVGVLFTLVNILNVMEVPQPLWVTFASFAIFLPFAIVGGLLMQPRPPAVVIDGQQKP